MLFGLCKIVEKGSLIGYRLLDSDKLEIKDVTVSSIDRFNAEISGNIDSSSIIKCIDTNNPDRYNLNIINRQGRYADKLPAKFIGISKDISKHIWVLCGYNGKEKVVSFNEYDSLAEQGRIINYDVRKAEDKTSIKNQTVIKKDSISEDFIYSIDTMELKQYRGNSQYVSIPFELNRINEGAFARCSNIDELFIKGRKLFSKGAFRESSIKVVSIVDNEILQVELFEDSSIEEFRADSKLIRINDRAFRNCNRLYKLIVDTDELKIGNSAFFGCKNLREIPAKVVEVGHNAFANSGLTHIELADELDYIGNGAFKNCKSLVYLEIPGNIQGIGLDIIKGSNVNTIYINRGAVIDDVQSLLNDSVKHIIGYRDSFIGYDIDKDTRFDILG